MTIVLFVSTDSMIALANDMFARFEAYVMARRCDQLDELADMMASRYAPFVENHPKAKHFASLMDDEMEFYCADAQGGVLQHQARLIYLEQWRMKLDDLFLSQLRICGEDRLADELVPELKAEQAALATARSSFVTFGTGLGDTITRMERLWAKAQDEENEAEVRSLAASVMRTIRSEWPNIEAYVPRLPVAGD